ncbi:MAG: preprotein translocase subunit SecE [Elusimicrobia bacterium]|nr:preprotein translocase subunit SecE [Elusimicrobiota bacterium]MDE2236960.1 preprotein translocase subunit SecE [Elusimicrobiota bacterium]MDE2425433.1 preprotein translocase subunit SecE [Elusimicrobiota bacterium]
MNNIATQFVKEAYIELRRSTWLTRKEAMTSTWAVIILVAIFSVYIAGVDFVLSGIMRYLLGR